MCGIDDSKWDSVWVKGETQATVGLAGIARSAIAMPMVQTSHAWLSSLVCDGNKERGKIIVGVAAHSSSMSSMYCQKSGSGLVSRRSSSRTHVHASIVMRYYTSIFTSYLLWACTHPLSSRGGLSVGYDHAIQMNPYTTIHPPREFLALYMIRIVYVNIWFVLSWLQVYRSPPVFAVPSQQTHSLGMTVILVMGVQQYRAHAGAV
jgi:hypothetical protein